MWKRRKSINYRQENAGTSCLGSKTGSDAIFNFTIAFRIQKNLLPEKTARINQLQAGKRWHFLFGEWKQEAATFLASPWCSASRGALSVRKQCESINYRRENEGTSCLASKTGSDNIYGFIIVSRIPRYPSLRKRQETINYRQENAVTSCLLSKTGSEVILNFTNVFSIPRNPHPEKKRHGSINIWQENADTFSIPVKFVGFPLYFPQTFHWLKLGSVS